MLCFRSAAYLHCIYKRIKRCTFAASIIWHHRRNITEKPIAIHSGIGLIHEAITTSSRVAQAYYDQGLTFLYSYDWIDAARSFTEALRKDPKLAMAHMGLSYAFSGLNDARAARAAEDEALSQIGFVSGREAIPIRLRDHQLRAMIAENQGLKYEKYFSELRKALTADQSNIQLLILSGNAAEGTAYGRGQQGGEDSISYYEGILKYDAQNPVAHHFLAHSYEMLNDIEQAANQASIFVHLAPSLPHAHHMYGHELLRRGKVEEAVAQFEQADALAEVSWADDQSALMHDWHYRHNLNLLAAAYRHAGRFQKAEAVLKKLARLPCWSETDEYYQAQLAAFLLEKGRYTDAMRSLRDYMRPHTGVGYFFEHIIKGSISANSPNSTVASAELSKATKYLRDLDPGWKPGLQSWIEALRTQIEIAQLRRAAARQRLISEIQALEASPGTDAWSDALFHLEYFGEIAARAKLWDAARSSGERLRRLAPNYSEGQLLLLDIQGQQPPHSPK